MSETQIDQQNISSINSPNVPEIKGESTVSDPIIHNNPPDLVQEFDTSLNDDILQKLKGNNYKSLNDYITEKEAPKSYNIDDYQLLMPDGINNSSDYQPYIDEAKKKFHELQISPETAPKLFKEVLEFNQKAAAIQKEREIRNAQEKQVTLTELSMKKFGNNDLIRGKELIQQIQNDHHNLTPDQIVDVAHTMLKQEKKFTREGVVEYYNTGSIQNNPINERNKIMQDPAYLNSRDPKHSALHLREQELVEKMVQQAIKGR